MKRPRLKTNIGGVRLFLRLDSLKSSFVFCTILVSGARMTSIGYAIFNRDGSEWESLRKRMGTNGTVPLTILPAETNE